MASEQNFVHLDAESEWRFELEADETIAIRVQSPDPVYINSEELPPTTWYPLHRYLKGALYAPTPAKIEVTTMPASQYSSSSTNQPALISLHLALERLRILARRNQLKKDPALIGMGHGEEVRRGPRVMVLGPPSSGKSTAVKNLVNMALGSGMGWTPGVVSLDPASPSNLIPGSLSLSTPSHPIPSHHLAHPLGSPPASIPSSTLGADVPTLGWWYGHFEPTTKGTDVWRKLVASMGERFKERCEKDPLVLASGAFIDTSSAFVNPSLGARKDDTKTKYALVAHAIEQFEVETLLVIGHEKLTIDLTRLFPSVQVIRIPKSGGTVDLDDNYRQIAQSQSVRGYFYGEPPLPPSIATLTGRMVSLEGALSPYSFQIGWETLTILRVGEGGPAHVVRLLNTVLAVVALVPGDRIKKDKSKEEVKAEVKEEVKEETAEGEEEDEPADEDEDEVPFVEEIGWREITGFIVITAIDTIRKKYTILSPSPGKLPSKVALAGSIEWVDSA